MTTGKSDRLKQILSDSLN